MRPNGLREGVSRGELQIGSWINMVHNPAILTMMKAAGLDFARIDMEHAMPSTETIANFALLSRALNFPIAVRPPSNSQEWIQRLLDAGVWNLHCAGVETAEEAAAIVSASRYWPMGSRGMAVRSPATEFEMTGSVVDRMAFANKQVFVTVMFESASSLDHLEEIAAMDGIDAMTIGPTDLAQDMGIYGTPEQARIIDEKRELVIAAAKKYGKTCAMLVQDDAQAKKMADAGVLIIAYKSDTHLLFEGFSKMAALKR